MSFKAEKTTGTPTNTKKSKAYCNGNANRSNSVDPARPKPPDTTAKRNSNILLS